MTVRWSAAEAGADLKWIDDDELLTDEPSTSYPPDNLVTLRFLWDAVRRHTRIWVAIAMIGLITGLAVPAVLPAASQSSAKLLLTHREGDDPVRAMATDVSLITTQSVAQRVIDDLGLEESPDELLETYAVTPLTDRVLEIVVSAPSSEEATRLAGALADTYLAFRQEQILLQEAPLQEDLAAARADVAAALAEVEAAGGDPRDPNPPRSPEATRLTRAIEQERFIEHQILDEQAAAARMSSSGVLDAAAPVPYSARLALLISIGSGLVAGLFLGVGFVIVRALVSDRLWRRQDIARVIGAPVQLSVGKTLRLPSWPFPRYLRQRQMKHPDVRLVVQHLRRNVVWSDTPKPALAVISLDDVRSGAIIVASLAMSFAAEGKHVLVADLTDNGALAETLGVTSPGTHASRFSSTAVKITVHLPEALARLAGERYRHLDEPDHSTAEEEDLLGVAWVRADLVLTLATLSPAFGAEHLRPWASRIAALVTAGRSSTAKIRATGEMVGLAGLRLDSVVLLGADRNDESVGLVNSEASPAADHRTSE